MDPKPIYGYALLTAIIPSVFIVVGKIRAIISFLMYLFKDVPFNRSSVRMIVGGYVGVIFIFTISYILYIKNS